MSDDTLSNFESVVQILLTPAQDWDSAAVALRDESVDTAVGARLETQYGHAVGLLRSASPLFSPVIVADDPYRRAIRAQIATNHSVGQRGDIIRISRLILDDTTATLGIRRSGTAALLVQVGGAAVLSTTEAVLVLFLTRAVSNGVRVVVSSFAVPPAGAFLLGSGGAPTGPGTLGDTRTPGSGSALMDTRSIDG